VKRFGFAAFFALILGMGMEALHSYPVPLHGGLALLRSFSTLALMLMAWLAMGRALLLRFGVFTASLSQEALLSLALGSGLSSVLIFILGHFGSLSPGVAWGLLLFLSFPFLGNLEHFLGDLRHALRSKHPWQGSSTEMLWLFAAGVSALIIFALCMAPVSFYDALVYHLALPQQAAGLGASPPLAGNLYSWLPGGAERLWTLALLMDGERAASLLNGVFALATALAVADTGARFLPRTHLWLPAALFLAQPLIALAFGVFGSDGPASFYSLLSLACFLNTFSERNQSKRDRWLLLAALLAGFSAAVKPVTTAHAVALLLILALRAALGEEEARPTPLLAAAGLFLAPLLPWALRNYAACGNPFMPFGMAFFGKEIFHGGPAAYFEHMKGYGAGLSWWSLPWELSFGAKAGAFGNGGPPSFLFLALFPAVFFVGLGREMRWLALYLFFSFCIWALGPWVLRYTVPLIPGACILASSILAELESWARSEFWARLLRLSLAFFLMTGSAQTGLIAAKDFKPLNAALGIEEREEYLLSRGVQYAKAQAWLKEQVPKARVLVLGDSRLAGWPAGSLACTVFDSHPFKAWLEAAQNPDDLDAILLKKGYDFALLNFSEWNRINNGPEPHYDYFSSPEKEALFKAWLDQHQGRGYQGEGVELFPLS
jgi:hypothetical protein